MCMNVDLPGAGGARDGHELAGLDVERDAAQRADLVVAHL